MLRTIFILGLLTFAGACPAGVELPQGITELGCSNCHGLNAKVVGPSWADIANRYRDKRDDQAVLDQLVRNVSGGSRNNWGNLPMTASDPTGKKRDQIVAVLKFILDLPAQPAPAAKGQPAASSVTTK